MCCQRHKTAGVFIHSWWEWKTLKPHFKTSVQRNHQNCLEIPREMKTHWLKNLFVDVYSKFSHDHHDCEIIQTPFNWGIKKQRGEPAQSWQVSHTWPAATTRHASARPCQQEQGAGCGYEGRAQRLCSMERWQTRKMNTARPLFWWKGKGQSPGAKTDGACLGLGGGRRWPPRTEEFEVDGNALYLHCATLTHSLQCTMSVHLSKLTWKDEFYCMQSQLNKPSF